MSNLLQTYRSSLSVRSPGFVCMRSFPSMNHNFLYLSDIGITFCIWSSQNQNKVCNAQRAFSNVDEFKLMEIYIVVLSRNGCCKVPLCKSIHVVLLYSEDRWCYILSMGSNCVSGCTTKNILMSEAHCNPFVHKHYSMRESQ